MKSVKDLIIGIKQSEIVLMFSLLPLPSLLFFLSLLSLSPFSLPSPFYLSSLSLSLYLSSLSLSFSLLFLSSLFLSLSSSASLSLSSLFLFSFSFFSVFFTENLFLFHYRFSKDQQTKLRVIF